MSKKTQRECVPLPQAQPQLSVDVPCQRKHRGRMYSCHKPSPTCQQMFHVKENTEGGCTAATSQAPPVSRCSMTKKTEREDVPLPHQPHLSVDVPCQIKHRGGMYRCHKPRPTCQQIGACGSGTSSLCVFFDMEHLLTGGAGLVAAVHPPSLFSLTWNIY